MVFRQASKHTAWTLSNYPPGKMCLCHCCFCTFGGSTQFRASARQLSCRGLFRRPPLKLGGGGAARPVHPMVSKILFCFLMKMLAGDLKTNAPCPHAPPRPPVPRLSPACLPSSSPPHSLSICPRAGGEGHFLRAGRLGLPQMQRGISFHESADQGSSRRWPKPKCATSFYWVAVASALGLGCEVTLS